MMTKRELAQRIANYHNVLMTMQVSGESVLALADVVRDMRKCAEDLLAEASAEAREDAGDGMEMGG